MRYATRSEQRLAELEALKRPLNEEETVELRKCLHAIYMHQWRAERAMHAAAMKEHKICLDTMAQAEIEPIARRMEEAKGEDWPLPKAHDWQDHAREASVQLRNAILNAQARQRERMAA